MQVASSGYAAGLLHQETEKEDVSLTVRLDRATRSDLERIQSLKVTGHNGHQVALGELVHVEKSIEDKSIYHKNLMPVTYVTADICGRDREPVYAVLKLGRRSTRSKSQKATDRAAYGGASSDPERYSISGTASGTSPMRCFAISASLRRGANPDLMAMVRWFQSFVTVALIQ